MNSSKVQHILDVLQEEQFSDLRQEIAQLFLQDEKRGAQMIVEFAAGLGEDVLLPDVIDAVNDLDDDDWDIELTPDMLMAISGGKAVRRRKGARDTKHKERLLAEQHKAKQELRGHEKTGNGETSQG